MLPSGISSTPTSNCTSEGDLPVWGDLLGSLLAVRAAHHDHVRELGGSLDSASIVCRTVGSATPASALNTIVALSPDRAGNSSSRRSRASCVSEPGREIARVRAAGHVHERDARDERPDPHEDRAPPMPVAPSGQSFELPLTLHSCIGRGRSATQRNGRFHGPMAT
jgi:hypothetical protein